MVEKKYNFDDEQSVADLLGILPRVDAPGNFDARVRSRIAKERPASRTGWLIPSAAAVSLCAILLAAMAFVYLGSPDEQVAGVSQPAINPVSASVSESPSPQFAESRNPEPLNVTKQPSVSDAPAPEVVAEKGDAPVSRPKTTTSPKGGDTYYDSALRSAKDPIVPFGTSPTPEVSVRPPGPVVKVSAREILQLIGLDAEFRDGGWLVTKVIGNSAAAKSGIREGDVIEAIDDAKITGNTTFEGGFSGRSLTVLRDGNRQTMNMRNR